MRREAGSVDAEFGVEGAEGAAFGEAEAEVASVTAVVVLELKGDGLEGCD